MNTTHWLVIDIRRGQIAVRRVDCGGPLPQVEKRMVHFQLGPAVPVDLDRCDLAFYQEPGSRGWSMTRRDHLAQMPEDYQKVPALLDLPEPELSERAPRLVHNAIKDHIKEFAGLPLLFLCDRPAARKPLSVLLEKLTNGRLEGAVLLVPARLVDCTGFALLDPLTDVLPAEGATFHCEIKSAQEEAQRVTCTWRSLGFEYQRAGAAQQNVAVKGPFQFEGDPSDLERVGAVMYGLVWQARLEAEMRQKLADLRRQVQAKQRLVDQMSGLMQRLAAGATAT